MNKKKLIAMITCLMLIAAIAVGGTLAYFMDDENATNVFTIGNVEIDLVEEQRDGKGGLETFEDGKILVPIVGDASEGQENWSNDKYNVYLPSKDAAKNWVDKIVTVDNEGTEPAYVRVLMAFPADMDGATYDAMMLHWNADKREPDEMWDRKDCGIQIELGNRKYNVYNFTYVPVLEAGDTTEYPAMKGVYIDKRVDAYFVNDDGVKQDQVGHASHIIYHMTTSSDDVVSAKYPKNEGPKIVVIAQGIQAAGFEDVGANAALTEGFGAITTDNALEWFSEAYEVKTADLTDIDDEREDITAPQA